MNLLLVTLLVFPWPGLAGTEDGKTFSHVMIRVDANTLLASGGERLNVHGGVYPIVLGRSMKWSLSKLPHCAFGVRPGSTYEPETVMGWQVDVTPLSVDGDTVRFRIAWERGIDRRQPSQEHRGELELTLRPGESMPLDLVRFAAGDSERLCAGATLSVSVVPRPNPEDDRRLLATDLWLVERLPDGQERSQQVSLRGRYNELKRFYFDELSDRNVRLEIYGEVVARPRPGYVELFIATHRLFVDATGAARRPLELKSQARVGVDDVAAIELPSLVEKSTGAFRDRVFSLRVRSREVRGDGAAMTRWSERQDERVFVIGEIRRPGAYAWKAGMTVSDAISLAGGFTSDAAAARIYVSRKEDGKELRVPVTQSDSLRPNATLVVPRRRV